MASKLFCISAGHTNQKGQDRGAVGNGYIEGVEAVILRDRIYDLLNEKGLSVVRDGVDGLSEPLSKALVLGRKSDIAIEFHFNAGPETATGIEVLAKSNKKRLAQEIAEAIHEPTKLKLRGENGYKPDNAGQHHRLAFCDAGGLVVEVCFISNLDDMARYKQNFETICQNIANVLAKA